MNILSLFESAVSASEEQRSAGRKLIGLTPPSAPEFWRSGVCREICVPVDGAEIRVFHKNPVHKDTVRPVVVVPGWGVVPEIYQEFYRVLHGRVEWFYLETREKNSSRILGRRADMSVGRSARDIGQALEYLGLLGSRDFVLFGTSWGSTLILQGLMDNSLKAPTVVTNDPVHELQFPKWFLKLVTPLLPMPVLGVIAPILRALLVGSMKEKKQKERNMAIAKNADLWKWKKTAEAAADFQLFRSLASIPQELFVLNGSEDKFHQQLNFPKIANELPRGRFLSVPVGEAQRERMMAAVCLEFAKVSAKEGLPFSLAGFERPIR